MNNYPELATGYFAHINDYIEHGYFPVSIARFAPNWVNNIPTLLEAAPSEELLHKWKNKLINEVDYYAEYVKTTLCNLHVKDFVDKMFKLSNNKPVVMLCYEKSEDFCHRHILAKHITGMINLPVKELFEIRRGLLNNL